MLNKKELLMSNKQIIIYPDLKCLHFPQMSESQRVSTKFRQLLKSMLNFSFEKF